MPCTYIKLFNSTWPQFLYVNSLQYIYCMLIKWSVTLEYHLGESNNLIFFLQVFFLPVAVSLTAPPLHSGKKSLTPAVRLKQIIYFFINRKCKFWTILLIFIWCNFSRKKVQIFPRSILSVFRICFISVLWVTKCTFLLQYFFFK